MTATHLAEITDKAIATRLKQVTGCNVEKTGSEPCDTERLGRVAGVKLYAMKVAAVRAWLDSNATLDGETARDEIDMAISMAAAPADLSEHACVNLLFSAF